MTEIIVEGVEMFAYGLVHVVAWISYGFGTAASGFIMALLFVLALPILLGGVGATMSNMATSATKHPPAGTLIDGGSDRYVYADGAGGEIVEFRDPE